MFEPNDSQGHFIPITALRPFGVPSEKARDLESQIISSIQVPSAFDLGRKESWQSVYVARTWAQIAKVVDAYKKFPGPEEEKERNLDILHHVARDPDHHVVIVSQGSSGISGYVVLRRSIEYVSARDGTPIVARMIHDVVSAVRGPYGSRWDLAEACGHGAMSDVLKLHQSLARVAAGLVASRMMEAVEEGLPFFSARSLRIECHVKGSAGTFDQIVQAVGAAILAYSSDAGDFDAESGFAGPAHVVGPFYPGTWFEAERKQPHGHTSADLRRREILRSGSMIAHSDFRRVWSEEEMRIISGRRNPDIEACYASPEVFGLGSIALDPAAPHPMTVFGGESTDPRRAQIYVYDCEDRRRSVFFEFVRTLDLEVEAGAMWPLVLDLKVCHVLGETADEELLIRMAEVIYDQALSDIYTLSSSLTAYEGDLQVRFRVPAFMKATLQRVIETEWTPHVSFIEGHQSAHKLLPPLFIEEELRPNKGAAYEPKRVFEPLPVPVEIDSEAVIDLVEENYGDLNGVDEVEVLQLEGSEPIWLPVDHLDGDETTDPFLLVRGWVGGVPVPLVYSTLSSKYVPRGPGEAADTVKDFIFTLHAQSGAAAEPSPMPIAVRQLEQAAQSIFARADIRVAAMKHVAYGAHELPMLFADDMEDSERRRHIIACSFAERMEEYADLGDYLPPQHCSFHVAIHDDARLDDDIKGIDAVLAEFLSKRVVTLLDIEVEVEEGLVFPVAVTYVRRILGMETSRKALRPYVTDVREFMRHGYGYQLSEKKTFDALMAAVDDVVADIKPEPIYMVVARLAQAHETFWQAMGSDDVAERASA
jgi:hypothetical protein